MDLSADVVVGPVYRTLAPELAALQRRTALAAYGHIFPAEAPPPTQEGLLAQWVDVLESSTAYLASAGDRAVGVVCAGADPAEPGSGHLARLYVEPTHWGRGIGRRLHDVAVDHLEATGFASATLWVLERNEPVRAWYERLGWRATGERKAVWAPGGVDDLRYRVALS